MRPLTIGAIASIAGTVLLAGAIGATRPAQEGLPTWVISVKPNESLEPVRVRMRPGSYSATGISVRQLIMAAYDVRDYQVAGGPDWMANETFDVEARADREGVSAEDWRTMLRGMLAERFGLRLRREPRPLQGYALAVHREGPKLPRAEAEPEMAPQQRAAASADRTRLPPAGIVRSTMGGIEASAMSTAELARAMESVLRRPVVDKTGLGDRYQVRLQWAPAPGEHGPMGPVATETALGDRPSLFTAVQEQLGLQLDSLKEPVEVLVVDHLQRPTAN